MDLEKFHALYNFRKRTDAELQVLTQKLRDRSSSSSSSSSGSSSRSSSSSSYSSRSSKSRSRSRSLPYSSERRRPFTSEDSDENTDIIDELLEKPYANQSKRRSRSKSRGGRKRRKYQSRSSSSSSSDSESRQRLPQPHHFKSEKSVIISGLSAHISLKDVKDFVSDSGKIRDLQLDFCPDTLAFRNAALIEFDNLESVLLSLEMNGQKIKGTPIVVQPMRRDQERALNAIKKICLKIEGFPPSFSKSKLSDMLRPFGHYQIKSMKEKVIIISYLDFRKGLAAQRELDGRLLQNDNEALTLKVSVSL